MRDWIVTYKENGETRQKKVEASCIIEAISRSMVVQSSITGCVAFVDPRVYMAVDLASGPDTGVTYINNHLHKIMNEPTAAILIGAH